jgi:hypothetical protein
MIKKTDTDDIDALPIDTRQEIIYN